LATPQEVQNWVRLVFVKQWNGDRDAQKDGRPAYVNDDKLTLRLLISACEHSSTGSAGPRVELGTERESLLQVLDENAYFGGQPAAGRPYGKDRHSSFEASQKTYNSTFSEFRGEEPCRCLGYPQMFKDTHPHPFNIGGSKDSRGDNAMRGIAILPPHCQM
jgi:hypothetical protein